MGKPKQKFERTYSLIEDVLREIPETRNDDNLLLYHVQRLYFTKTMDNIISEQQLNNMYWTWEKIFRLAQIVSEKTVSLDTVSRIRRKIQEECVYLPTDLKVLRRRHRNEDEMRHFMRLI
jgi:hypothetical protein